MFRFQPTEAPSLCKREVVLKGQGLGKYRNRLWLLGLVVMREGMWQMEKGNWGEGDWTSWWISGLGWSTNSFTEGVGLIDLIKGNGGKTTCGKQCVENHLVVNLPPAVRKLSKTWWPNYVSHKAQFCRQLYKGFIASKRFSRLLRTTVSTTMP